MQFNVQTIYKNLNLIIIVAILGAMGAGFYFLKPEYDALMNTQGQVKAAETNLANSTKTLEDTKKLVKNYEGTKEQLRTLSLALPSEEDIPNLLIQLEALAVKNGVLMEEVGYSEETKTAKDNSNSSQTTDEENLGQKKSSGQDAAPNIPATATTTEAPSEGYATLKVSLSLTGKYDAFMKYLGDVQKNLRFLDVVSVDFDTKEKASQSNQTKGSAGEESGVKFEDRVLNFKLDLRTYYLK